MNRIIILIAAAWVFALSGCENNGKEYKLDKDHDIYYKGEGLDEAGAKKLAEYLKQQEYFQVGKEATVQVSTTKDTKDTINLSFVVDGSKLTPDLESNFKLFGGMISANVFAGKPLTVHLIDKYFKEFKNIGYAKPMAEEPAPAQPGQ